MTHGGAARLYSPQPRVRAMSSISSCLPLALPISLALSVVSVFGPFSFFAFHASRAAAQTVSSQSAYASLVARYQGGEFDAAVEDLSRWTSSQIAEMARLDRLADDQKTRAAAALLHSETMVRLSRAGATQTQQHLALARAAIRQLNAANFHPRFRHTWYLATVTFLLGVSEPELARSVMAEVPAELRNEPEMLLAAGFVDETAIGVRLTAGTDDALRAGALIVRKYRAALAQDPALVEARLRLGSLLLASDANEAASEFERVRREATSRAMQYLATVWLGRVQEQQGRVETAIETYRAAIELVPACQTAHLSLARLLLATGREDQASASAERMFAESATASPQDDPWLAYMDAQLTPNQPRWAELRSMVTR